jgi:tRNA pseudouridine38-40 synthase
VRTVQGDVESALTRLFGREVGIACAGRTDAGVHALGQVCTTTDALDGIDVRKLRHALNGMCGPAIAFTSCVEAPEGFHARFSARSRTYGYAILEGEIPDPFLARTTLHHPGRLDVDAMNEAAGHLVGPRDFSSFGRVPEEGASAERVLFELRARRSGRLVLVRARANAFIQQMVRSLVGTLIEVGAGKRSPDAVVAMLAARDRAAASPVAPPHGLCLVAVEYDEGWSRPPAT